VLSVTINCYQIKYVVLRGTKADMIAKKNVYKEKVQITCTTVVSIISLHSAN
jgi:hypothetical protein